MTNKKEKDIQQEQTTDELMSVQGHLKELRKRLVIVAVVFAVGLAIGLACSTQLTQFLMALGEKNGYTFVFIEPQELLMVYVRVALVLAIIVSIPVISYQLYEFAVPALTPKEKTAFKRALFFGFIMFGIGVAFAYFISLPFMLYFLINLKVGIAIEASISIQSFVSFVLTIFVIFGVVFELPVIVSLLTMLGLIKPNYLVKARKVAIVVIFLIAAIITPPDIVSQTMVAFPMIVLYQFSIWLSQMIDKNKKVQNAEDM